MRLIHIAVTGAPADPFKRLRKVLTSRSPAATAVPGSFPDMDAPRRSRYFTAPTIRLIGWGYWTAMRRAV